MADLALQMKLASLLEAVSGGGGQRQVPAKEMPELDRLLLALEQKWLNLAGEEAEPELEAVLEEVESDMEVPVMSAPVPGSEDLTVEAEIPPEPPPTAQTGGWTPQHDLLYEDILWLFKSGDNDGAIEGLGRLIDLAGETDELRRFLDINRKKLLGLFEKLVGGTSELVRLAPGFEVNGHYFLKPDEVNRVLERLASPQSVDALSSGLERDVLWVYSLLFRLGREGLVDTPVPMARA